jgi:hypothetical protein
MGLYLLDYGAGNVQSLANSLKKLGHKFTWIASADDFAKATVSSSFLPINKTPSTIASNRSALFSLV